ncbi:DUF2780 domain-containing protein [Endozoicomonas numazuensis]|uniref:DUF2780 domain-containing protein n=1 Tax=Endozoicomonas numazuensis TaxID=1137799 RepID=UPI00068F7C27|nr:DUF2780 domain-containing protein [Endozoicomonas numazuensis]
MKQTGFFINCNNALLFLFFVTVLIFQSPANQAMGLIDTLTSQLKVSQFQAEGGAGALLGLARSKLSKDDFSVIKEALPETPELLKAAPEAEHTKNSSSLLDSASLLGSFDTLSQQFKTLGLDNDMISSFSSVLINYFKDGRSSEAAGLLKSVLPSGLADTAGSLLEQFK